MKAIDKNTNEIMEVEPYYLHGRLVAYVGEYKVNGLNMSRFAWLPNELITDLDEHETGTDKED